MNPTRHVATAAAGQPPLRGVLAFQAPPFKAARRGAIKCGSERVANNNNNSRNPSTTQTKMMMPGRSNLSFVVNVTDRPAAARRAEGEKTMTMIKLTAQVCTHEAHRCRDLALNPRLPSHGLLLHAMAETWEGMAVELSRLDNLVLHVSAK